MDDTPEHVAEILRERMRRMPPGKRIEEGAKLCKVAREFMRAGIRMRHPDYSAALVEEALARLLWGDELYRKAKPGKPLIEP
ncbi:MAG TPA: hypothetical protein VHB21_20480 [Minicystis sp.]|nr:hypothetical protein [Minicystis sp.]